MILGPTKTVEKKNHLKTYKIETIQERDITKIFINKYCTNPKPRL